MRAMLTLLLLAMVAFSGCLSDDEATPDPEPTDGTGGETPATADEFEDFDNYQLEIATGHCHAKDYTDVVPGQVYQTSYNGGQTEAWLFQEANGIPGLQYEQNEAQPSVGVSFDLALDPRCTDGDQLVA